MSDRNQAKKRIQEAAVRVFVEQGSTEVNVSQLAEAAGIARSTIYKNVPDLGGLFDEVAADLNRELIEEAVLKLDGVTDPARRTSIGVRFCVRKAHDDPAFGRFMTRFGFSQASLTELFNAAPLQDIQDGVRQGRYTIDPTREKAAAAMVAGSTLSAMVLVIEGHQTWREAGEAVSEFLLRAFGVPEEEAAAISSEPLP